MPEDEIEDYQNKVIVNISQVKSPWFLFIEQKSPDKKTLIKIADIQAVEFEQQEEIGCCIPEKYIQEF